MMVAVVDFEKCAACERCEVVKICDTRAIIKIDPDEPAVIDKARCHACADCVIICPHGAISLTEV